VWERAGPGGSGPWGGPGVWFSKAGSAEWLAGAAGRVRLWASVARAVDLGRACAIRGPDQDRAVATNRDGLGGSCRIVIWATHL
jgi:hypothetical protein